MPNLLFWSCFLSNLSRREWEKKGADGDFTVSLIGIHSKATFCFLLDMKAGGEVMPCGGIHLFTCPTGAVWILQTFWAQPPEGALDDMKQQRTDLIILGTSQTHTWSFYGRKISLDSPTCCGGQKKENLRARARARDTQMCCPCRCVPVTAQMWVRQVW